jgi:hypothetical protein
LYYNFNFNPEYVNQLKHNVTFRFKVT